MLFGEQPIDPRSIAESLAWAVGNDKRLRNADGTFIPKNAAYTTVIRDVMSRLAFERACVCRYLTGNNGTEKLFDVIWLDDARLLRLALESEWDLTPDEIEYDFEKLLYAKTPLKIMIHSRQKQESEILPRLKRILTDYSGHVEGEEYIVIQLKDQKRPPFLHAVQFRVPKNGLLGETEVSFEAIDGSPFSCKQEVPGQFFDPDEYRAARRERGIAHGKYLESRMALRSTSGSHVIEVKNETGETASHIAVLAPVPLVHLQSAAEMKGRVAFGSSAWQVFRKLDELRKGEHVDVYIYASHDPDGGPEVSWHARYVGCVESGDVDVKQYRPKSTENDINNSAVFWLVEDLAHLPHKERLLVAGLTGYDKKKEYGHPFSPEGPLLIEHP